MPSEDTLIGSTAVPPLDRNEITGSGAGISKSGLIKQVTSEVFLDILRVALPSTFCSMVLIVVESPPVTIPTWPYSPEEPA